MTHSRKIGDLPSGPPSLYPMVEKQQFADELFAEGVPSCETHTMRADMERGSCQSGLDDPRTRSPSGKFAQSACESCRFSNRVDPSRSVIDIHEFELRHGLPERSLALNDLPARAIRPPEDKALFIEFVAPLVTGTQPRFCG